MALSKMSKFAPPAPLPPSVLGYHRVLSPTAGVRVSPLCLGAMNFGDAWKGFMGSCDKKSTFDILDYFFEQGGNFIDTSNNYQSEESETWIGEWMQERGNRDQLVVATKFTTAYPSGKNGEKIRSNFQGNHAKSLHVSVADSLRKLQTDYIDILYVHWWDFSTSIPELMQSLNRLISAGKVLYLGISDTPAWVVSKANEYARNHGMTQFSVYQGKWNASLRDFERDILPMCEAEGMALAPWGVLGSGTFRSEEEWKKEAEANEGRKLGSPSERDRVVSKKLEEIAKRKGSIITSIALAYVMHKAPYVYPIVGGRKVEHLKGNIEALKLKLTDEEIEEIEGAVPFDVGFPMNFLFGVGDPDYAYSSRLGTQDVTMLLSNAHLNNPEKLRPAPVKQE